MKKKKRSVFSKKEKLMLIGVAVVVLLVIILIATSFTKKVKDEKQQAANSSDLSRQLTSVEELIEYLESSFVSMSESSVNGYDLDINLVFKYHLYEDDKSKESYFTNMYEKIAILTQFKSFRLIDSSKGITIEVKGSGEGISEVRINGEIDYFKKENSRKSIDNELNVETKKLEINSQILQSLINNNWVMSNVDVGTQESSFYKYQIYFDEGYDIRVIRGKVFNLVFNTRYKDKVIENFKVGDDLEKIEATLGESIKDIGILGYKTKDFYIFFLENEISIYPTYKYDYTDFENLVKEYDEKKDKNEFLDKLTDIWPDYDKYTFEGNNVEIIYANRGVRVNFASRNEDGIEIYENYAGDLKEEKTDYTDLFYKLNENLFLVEESTRIIQWGLFDDSLKEIDPLRYSDRFYFRGILDDDKYTSIKIESQDYNYPNNEFDETIQINDYIWIDDSHLLYSVAYDGLFLYDAEKRTTEELIRGTEEFKIQDYDRDTRILKYDDKEVVVIL